MIHDRLGTRAALAGAALLMLTMGSGGALAQSDAPAEVPANPAPPGTLEAPPEQIRPGPPIGAPGSTPGGGGGVIVPPSNTDPGMVRPPPDGGTATTPVIPPSAVTPDVTPR